MSEVVVPDGWEVKKIGDLPVFISDGNYGEQYPTSEDFKSEGVPFLRANNIKNLKIDDTDTKFISNEQHAILASGHLKTNDILITTRGELGNLALINLKHNGSNINAQICLIRTINSDELNHLYLLYALDFEETKKQYHELETGTALKQLPKGNLRQVELLIPSIKEQEKIAKILSTLDKNIENTSKIIEKEKNIKKALMQELLANGIDKNAKIRSPKTHSYKQSKLGLIPEEWEVKALKDILTIQYGKDQKEVESEDGKYPILGSGGVIGYTNYFLYDQASVLIGRKGTINNPQYMETPFWTVDTLFYSHIKNNNVPKWVYYVFQSINWNSYNEASGVPSLSTSNINKIEILRSPQKEQEKIAKILSALDKKIESEQKNLSKLKELKKGLMSDLLSGKVRVKV